MFTRPFVPTMPVFGWSHGAPIPCLWLCQQFAIENGPVDIVDFPSYKMVDLSIAMLVYQRVCLSVAKHMFPSGYMSILRCLTIHAMFT